MTKTLRACLAVVVAIVLALAGWGVIERKAYVAAKAKADILRSDYTAYVEQAEAVKADMAIEAATLRAEKAAAIDAAISAESSKAKIAADLAAEKAKTAALPPDSLSGSINLRIGAGQSYPTGDGRFSFSRPGADATLDSFLEGEASHNLYEAERSVTANLRTALTAAESENGNLSHRLCLTQGELDRAVNAWGAETSALNHLRLSIIGRTVTTAAISFGVGLAVAWGLHAAGILK